MTRESSDITVLEDLQLPQLRKQIQGLKQQVETLTEVLTFNEQGYETVKQIVLQTTACETMTELDDVVEFAMVERTGNQARLYLLDEVISLVGFKAIRHTSDLPKDEYARLSGLDKIVSEPCRQENYNIFLDGLDNELGSLALIPVNYKNFRGVLVIGDHAPETFKPDHGTVFLEFIGSAVAITARRLLEEHRTG